MENQPDELPAAAEKEIRGINGLIPLLSWSGREDLNYRCPKQKSNKFNNIKILYS